MFHEINHPAIRVPHLWKPPYGNIAIKLVASAAHPNPPRSMWQDMSMKRSYKVAPVIGVGLVSCYGDRQPAQTLNQICSIYTATYNWRAQQSMCESLMPWRLRNPRMFCSWFFLSTSSMATNMTVTSSNPIIVKIDSCGNSLQIIAHLELISLLMVDVRRKKKKHRVTRRFPFNKSGYMTWNGLFRKSQSKMDDDWGLPYDSGNLHLIQDRGRRTGAPNPA